jgi:hypothetical protein
MAFVRSRRMKLAAISNLAAAMFGLSAHGALYTFDYSDSGVIPQGGTTFSIEHVISGVGSPVTDPGVEIILTFNDNSSLLGNSGGIQGHLILGTTGNSPFVNFYPVATSSSDGHEIYDVTFTGTSGSPGAGFNGLNPNDTWGLVLWDNGTNYIENALLSWTLDINAVPEPVNVALAIFGGIVVVGGLLSGRRSVAARLRTAAAWLKHRADSRRRSADW